MAGSLFPAPLCRHKGVGNAPTMVVRDTNLQCIFPYCGETLDLSYISARHMLCGKYFRQGVACRKCSQFSLVQNRKVAGVRLFF